MRLTRRTILVAGVAVLALLVYALARGGGSPSEQVQALQADPMAAYVPPRGTLIDSDSENEGTVLGRPVLARFSRLFQLPPEGGEAAVADARRAAAAAGWKVADGDARGFSAGRGRLELGVSLLDPRLLPEGATPPVLLVGLQHRGP